MKKEKTIEELVKEQLENSREEIIKNGIAGIKASVENDIQWKIGNIISKEIEELFNDEEMQKKLAEEMGKVKILFIQSFSEEFKTIIPKIVAEMAKNMQKKAIKNLTEDSYSMRDVYKNIFD